ncbi:hypothetical protein VTJ04DRAFT_9027 [Mycothermus thermophilus]|uniref:uncharacterized protein n=1 Tax=Humicola insolens TaxID=85995 RepID=UPI003742127B
MPSIDLPFLPLEMCLATNSCMAINEDSPQNASHQPNETFLVATSRTSAPREAMMLSLRPNKVAWSPGLLETEDLKSGDVIASA